MSSSVVCAPAQPAPRTQLNLDVHFKKSYGRREAVATLRNISITGAFLVCTDEELRADEKINLKFVVSGRQRKVAAQVVWKNSFGCGVKFLPLNSRDVQIVDDLIYFVENYLEDRRDVFEKIIKNVA
jgi:hypothetical protein